MTSEDPDELEQEGRNQGKSSGKENRKEKRGGWVEQIVLYTGRSSVTPLHVPLSYIFLDYANWEDGVRRNHDP